MRKIVAAVLLLVVAAPCALAAPKAEAKPPKIKMDAVEIRGELERPDVFYIIPRRKAAMDLGERTKNYSVEIMEPILPGPFEAKFGEKTNR